VGGEAFVAWVDTGQGYIYSNRYTPSGGWEPAETLSTVLGLGTPTVRALAIDSDGNAICIFADGESYNPQEFQYRRYRVGQGWGDMVHLLETGMVGDSNNSLKAVYNSKGIGVMTWTEWAEDPRPDGSIDYPHFNFAEVAPPIAP
jgi:hypothetical protein